LKKKIAFPALTPYVGCTIASHLPIDTKILNLSHPVESESLDARFKEERVVNQLAVRVDLSAMNLPAKRLTQSSPGR